jgi:hypothetical protein
MFRIDTINASPNLAPTTPIVTEPPGPNGEGGRYFTDGSAAGVSATLIQSEWLNMVQEELCQVVTSTSTLLRKDPLLHQNGPYTQLATAFRVLVGADDPANPGLPGVGSSIEEPDESDPLDPRYYSRNREPNEEDGYWTRAIDEPLDDGFEYNRAVPPNQIPVPPERPYGTWRRASGQKRLLTAATYFVRKNGSNANSGTSAATAWATIQHAVDTVTMDLDANGRIVTIDVGPSNEGDNLPWAGFHVRRPLNGARPHGFRIVGQLGSPETCEIGQMPRMDGAGVGSLPVPGAFELISVCASNGGKFAISGFLFPYPTFRGNIFVRAIGNASAISIEQDIVMEPRVKPAVVPGDPSDSTWANLSAMKGATIYLRASHTLKSYNYGAFAQATMGKRLFHAKNGGKILFSPNVIVNVVAGVGVMNAIPDAPHVDLASRSILDFGLTGNLQAPTNPQGNMSSTEVSIVSYGNDWELMTVTTLNQGTRIGSNTPPNNVYGMQQAQGDTTSNHGATAHRGMLALPRDPGNVPVASV